MKKTFLSLLLISSCFSLFVSAAQAQTTTGLSAIPPRLEITVQPGNVITKEIKVRNESQTERVINTNIKDFIVVDDLGTPKQVDGVLDETSNRWAASTWVQVSPSKLRLLPGETKSLQLTIITPDDATPGGHYAVVLHTPQGEGVVSQTGAYIQTNVGTLVYITVPGDINENALIRDFFAPSFSEFGPVNFKTLITNLSDIHVAPVGSINISNWLGGKIASLVLPATNIFPGTSRTFENILNRKWLFGRYKATLTAAYGATGQALTATLFFWVIPWRLLLLLFLVVIVFVALLALVRQRRQPTVRDQVDELTAELDNLKKKYRDHK